MNLGHNNSSQRSFMGDDMMAMKRCRYISSTEKELFVGTGTTCLVLYSSETHRIQVLHDIEAVYPRAHTMDIDPGNWNCDSFLNELSLRRINNRSVEIFVLLQEKSLTNTLFLRQWREWGLPAYFTEYVRVAPEKEYSDVTRGLGGVVIDCASGHHKINIFEVRRIKLEDDEEDTDLPEIASNSPMFLQHLSWLKDEFRIMMPEIPDTTLRALMILVQGMYASVGIDQQTDFSRLRHEDYPTFSTLYGFVQKQMEKSDYPMLTKEMIAEVLLYITDPTYGELSSIFNGTTTIDVTGNPLICFSMGALLEGSEQRLQAVENNLNTYIWSIVLQRKFQVLLSFDELYLYLEQPLMAKYISYFARRSRKYNACIGVATQQLGDCLDESVRKYSSPIINMSSFKFLFYSGQVDLQGMQEALKLTDGEAACISVSNKRHCLLKAGNGKYYMEIGTLPFEAALFGDKGGV